MKRFTINFIYLSLLAFSSIQASSFSETTSKPHLKSTAQPISESTPVKDILFAKPFRLEQGYHYDWREERPFVREGLIVVLKVDPRLVEPRNAAQPILFADDQIVQRLNHGNESGHSIVIIPGRVDLSEIRLWFASPSLFNQISTNTINYQKIIAKNDSLKPFNKQKINSISHRNVSVANLYVLLRDIAADLVIQYSPEDRHLASDWRLPVASK